MYSDMQNSIYHSILRVSSVALALVLLFDSGLVLPVTKELSKNTQFYLGNVVGVSAGVEATELSLMTAELTKKERELIVREQDIKEREIKLNSNVPGVSADSTSTFILSVILFILLSLIILNYGLDFARARAGQLKYAQGS